MATVIKAKKKNTFCFDKYENNMKVQDITYFKWSTIYTILNNNASVGAPSCFSLKLEMIHIIVKIILLIKISGLK